MPPQYIPAEEVDQVYPMDYLVYRSGALRRIEEVRRTTEDSIDIVASCDDDMEESSSSLVELSFVVNDGIIGIDPAIGISRYA